MYKNFDIGELNAEELANMTEFTSQFFKIATAFKTIKFFIGWILAKIMGNYRKKSE